MQDVTTLYLYEHGPHRFWPQWLTPEPVWLSFFEDQVRVTFESPLRRLPPGPGAGLFSALGALLARHRAQMSGVQFPGGEGRDAAVWGVLYVPARGRTVNDAVVLARDAKVIADAVLAEGEFTHAAAADLVRAGRADLLVGQRESAWFDAKRDHYGREESDRYELAKDVAAMANREGGLIVIGLATRHDRQGDVISKLMPVQFQQGLRRSIQDTLRRWVYPSLAGVRVELIATGSTASAGVVLIDVPPQPPELLPILVRGARLDGTRLAAEHITLPTRDGEETVFADIGQIHALLVAGRASTSAASTPTQASVTA